MYNNIAEILDRALEQNHQAIRTAKASQRIAFVYKDLLLESIGLLNKAKHEVNPELLESISVFMQKVIDSKDKLTMNEL